MCAMMTAGQKMIALYDAHAIGSQILLNSRPGMDLRSLGVILVRSCYNQKKRIYLSDLSHGTNEWAALHLV